MRWQRYLLHGMPSDSNAPPDHPATNATTMLSHGDGVCKRRRLIASYGSARSHSPTTLLSRP
eukprot:713714-Prorocentrum_minimum.AAC.1